MIFTAGLRRARTILFFSDKIDPPLVVDISDFHDDLIAYLDDVFDSSDPLSR